MPRQSDKIRIAVCNLQTGIGTTRGYWHYITTAWKYLLPHGSGPAEDAARFLRSENIDVAFFCEIEGGSSRTRGIDQVSLLAKSTPLVHHAFFPTLVEGERINQGNAVCARYPLRPVANHRLTGTGEPRYLSEAELQVDPGNAVRIFVAHLSLKRKVRASQIRHLVELLRRSDRPTMLAGDFNIEEEAELELLQETRLMPAASIPTFPSWNPKKPLDHVFLSEHFTVCGAHAFDGFRFSDHLPLVVSVKV